MYLYIYILIYILFLFTVQVGQMIPERLACEYILQKKCSVPYWDFCVEDLSATSDMVSV